MIPWTERVPMLSIHPDAASREEVARMAAELMEALRSIDNLEHESKALAHLHSRCVDERDAAEAKLTAYRKYFSWV